MVDRRGRGMLSATTPGDIPGESLGSGSSIATEQRVQQARRDKNARRQNRAYGTLDVGDYDERRTQAPRLTDTGAGRPRKDRM